MLRRWFKLIEENTADLAQILTYENGKPVKEAVQEITYANSFVDWFAEEAKRVYGYVLSDWRAGRRTLALRQPVGVAGLLTPWNFPAAMITRKLAPALAVGCTAVIKPSEYTPHTALALAELALRAGFPPGVVHVLTTANAAAVGSALTSHQQVRAISFTGSTGVGKLLAKQSCETMKKVSLELGGNAPFIVFPDAELPMAVQDLVDGKFRGAGQACVAPNRILVHDDVYAEFARQLSERVNALLVGDGFSEGVHVGPLIHPSAAKRVSALVAEAVEAGAIVQAGKQGQHPLGPAFCYPVVLTEVNESMRLSREEIFGPVLALSRFREEGEVIREANSTRAGLSAYLYTKDATRQWRVASALESGMVGINETLFSSEVTPFGGVKESGIGREGSMFGIDEYLELKYICLRD